METVFSDWRKFEEEAAVLQERHKLYRRKIDDLNETQLALKREIAAQSESLTRISLNAKRYETVAKATDKEKLIELKEKFKDNRNMLQDLQLWLPQKNAWMLTAHLGSIKASFLTKEDKMAYKEEYERFKFVITLISIFWSFTNAFIVSSRIMDALYHFLLVWYYCTATLREHVLRTNGSHIMSWWIAHHYLSIVISSVLLVWPEGTTYNLYRYKFFYLTTYVCIVQLMQYYYQSGHIYRLRALGGNDMHVTVEGFQWWMWRGLTFLIPFLVTVYLLELYNAYVLYHLSFHPECVEWQVPVIGVLWLVLALGNFLALGKVIVRKFQHKKDFHLTTKYKFTKNE